MSEQGARELLAAEYEASGLVTAANFIRASATDDLKCLNVNDRYAIRAIAAAKEQGRREAIAEVVARVMKVIESGYRGIDAGDKCEHDRYGFEDCIACYDEALIAALNGVQSGDATQA